MALIMMEGFDTYTDRDDLLQSGWDYAGADCIISTHSRWTDVAPRGSIRLYQNNYIYKSIPSEPGVLITGFDYYADHLYAFPSGSTQGNYEIQDHGVRQLMLSFGSHNNDKYPARVWDGGGVVIGQGTTLFKIGTWYNIVMKVKFHATEGTIDVYINGVREIALTNISTTWTTSHSADRVLFRSGYNYNSGVNTYYDNIWVFDDTGTECNDVIHGARIVARMPIADDPVIQDWTGTFEDVDEATLAHDGDTTFISADTIGDEARFTFQPIAGLLPNAIYHAVDIKAWTKAYEGDFFTKIAVSHGGTTVLGDEKQNISRYNPDRVQMSVAPDGAPLDETVVDAIQGGIKVSDIRIP